MQLTGPIFYSSNLEKSVKFFKTLGLRVVNIDEDKFASLEFEDGKQLGIKNETGGREIPGSQTMMVKPNDIIETYDQMKERGIDIVRELKSEDWGKLFIVQDPDGNWIEFIDYDSTEYIDNER